MRSVLSCMPLKPGCLKQSEHPFDTWFREGIMAVYDIENADAMEMPREILQFYAASSSDIT